MDMANETEKDGMGASTLWLVLGVVAVIGLGTMLFRNDGSDESSVNNAGTNTGTIQGAPATQTNTIPNEPQPSSSAPAEQPATP
jgi:hypothetical protein